MRTYIQIFKHDTEPKTNIAEVARKVSESGEAGAILYNKIASYLYKDFSLSGAELVLLIWQIVKEMEINE